jgi:hypothetical protein
MMIIDVLKALDGNQNI